MTDSQRDLSAYGAEQLNRLAATLTELFGFLPLGVRYGAAAAALAYVAEHPWSQRRSDEPVHVSDHRPIWLDERASDGCIIRVGDRSSSGPRDSGEPGLVSPTSPPRLAVRVGVQELDLDPAHPTLPRIDVIGFYLGEARVLRGVSNPRPRPDVAPEGWLVLGAVLVEPCQTLVTAADIRQGHSDAGRGGFFPWRA